MSGEKLKNYFRWILLLPGALIAGFLATFPLHWILWLLSLILASNGEPDPLSIRFFIELFIKKIDFGLIEYTLYPSVISATFILAGQKIAPKYKFKTAVVLFVIYIVTWSIASFITFQFSTRTILALLGAILGLYQAKRLAGIKLSHEPKFSKLPPTKEEPDI